MSKILLCDDDEDISMLMQVILQPLDIDVVWVGEISDINKLVQKERPDLILMDLWIPEIGGEIAIKTLKNNPETAGIPVLLFSANHRLDEICEEVKADGCIKKPFDVAEMRTKVCALLNLGS